MAESKPIVLKSIGSLIPPPEDLMCTAVNLTGLAEVLYTALYNGQNGDGIRGAAHIGWGYRALAELAIKLADDIDEYAS